MANLIEATTERALKMLRALPRVQISNLRPNPQSKRNVINVIKLTSIILIPALYTINKT